MVLNVGYLDAQFEEFLVGCVPPAEGCRRDISSLNEPINSPTGRTFLGATYRWELGVGDLAAHLGYQYRSRPRSRTLRRASRTRMRTTCSIVGVSYTTANQAWRFALEGKNVLDEEYRVAGYDFGNTNISQIGFYGPPRTVAVSATYRY